ncbi:MAG: hypothetical protein NT033_02910 [Candidatus Omnitrophica bacterium]|nr:hypothetical protein [Candidatus Omnitrophota bacterium]
MMFGKWRAGRNRLFGYKRLELDRIGPCFGRLINHFKGGLLFPVMVNSSFSYNEYGSIIPNPPITYFYPP